ncbi:DUF5605 domain-containing protein [Duganella sp. sic0402]|uniref:DUF5605 domain-containing protein n=1 Tax=Duganella sp. sic0402 TaxID=2854786 RepID=UPI001C458F0A|nr:DUF5605 domain-containing protein [Duganella sp. sic0402]MBV7534703.1 DUF5605 domain-containing protein [Duganella sp. sic0402]
MCALHSTSWAQQRVPKYGIYEITLPGPTAGNPDASLELSATFRQGDNSYRPEGFYDGDGVYKIRFMPDREGEWTYTTHSNYAELNNKTGALLCVESKNRGPVRVANTYHFAYADGSRFYPFGTTIYEWAFQPESRKLQTLATLKGTAFNKARMLAVPPYKPYYVQGPDKLTQFPFVGTAKENFDFSRFNPAYFRSLERDVQRLSDLGIQVDLILFRPYDKGQWGFDTTNDDTNRRFVKYMVARFAAFQNIWWSLANENSYIKHLSDEDFDHYFQLVQKYDPYNHLRSIHNADRLYDYNKPWVTHVSLQYYNAVKVFGVSPLLRDIYKKPIVHDEINYEGNSASRWGQLSGEELTRRFWIALTGGAYATHGEIIDNGWIGGGGKLDGSSPQRIAFLRKIVESGPAEGLTPIDQAFVMNAAGKAGDYYLYYLGEDQPKQWAFVLPQRELRKGMRFQVDVIDTWNMTISRVPETFELTDPTRYTVTDKDKRVVKLPGKPFMALRIQRIGAPVAPLQEKKSTEIVEEEL